MINSHRYFFRIMIMSKFSPTAFLTKQAAWLIYFSLIGLYAFSLWALVQHQQAESFFSWQEMGHILAYSSYQALLSALISTGLGILLAKAFFYIDFKGKALLYNAIQFVWALPSLVIIFAVIGIWGNSGWLAQLWQTFGFSWQFNVYGLQGILIAHCLLNIPLVTKYSLSALMQIPSSQYQLAAQLNLTGWAYFQIVELPALKRLLPYVFMTVFLICFTSFPIVLMLGGSPKYSTLEVAIYQAVSFEFDFAKAVKLIAVQLVVGISLQVILFLVSQRAFQTKLETLSIDIWKPKAQGFTKAILQSLLWLQSLLIILPLVSVIWAGITVSNFIERLLNPLLWEAVFFSTMLSLIASLTALSISYFIALEARKLLYQQKKLRYALLSSAVTYPLILPVFLLAVGLFLLLKNMELSTVQLLWLVGLCNGMTLLPFIYPLLFAPLWQTLTTQDKLAKSLGLSGFQRWWIAEKHYLIRPFAQAFALAMSASLGSFAVIAFFGSPDFSSLPYLLYQQLGSYRTEDAAVTAFILMLFTFLPFLLTRTKA